MDNRELYLKELDKKPHNPTMCANNGHRLARANLQAHDRPLARANGIKLKPTVVNQGLIQLHDTGKLLARANSRDEIHHLHVPEHHHDELEHHH